MLHPFDDHPARARPYAFRVMDASYPFLSWMTAGTIPHPGRQAVGAPLLLGLAIVFLVAVGVDRLAPTRTP